MGWLLIVFLFEFVFPNLVGAFYAKARYHVGGPISYTLRGAEIELDANAICRIIRVPIVRLRIYESQVWPTIMRFEHKKVIKRIYGLLDAHGMSKSSTNSLTVICRVLHHMLCFAFLPRDGHQDKVSYYEAFLMDSILIGRRIHLGYLMMMHMITCYKSTTRAFSYRHFLSLVFKKAIINLSREIDCEAPSIHDMYNDQSLRRMKFEKAPNDSWIRKVERELAQAWAQPQPSRQGQVHPRVEEETEIRQMKGGVDPQGGQLSELSLIFFYFRHRFLHKRGVLSLSLLFLSH